MGLKNHIRFSSVKENEIEVYWLEKTGFLIKDSDDDFIDIDPYLTDCCEGLYGFKRFMPKLIAVFCYNILR